jgi:signal transduction histidine kinase
MTDSRESLEAGASGAGDDRSRMRARSGLLTRIGGWALVVSVALGVVFAVLILSVLGLRQRSLEARRSQEVIATANRLQTRVVDLETGLRGFVITRNEKQLAPWRQALREYPEELESLIRLTNENPEQMARAQRIGRAIRSYLTLYSAPLLRYVRDNPQVGPRIAIEGVGQQEAVPLIRQQFRAFTATEEALARKRDDRASRTARLAVAVGGAGFTAALLLILAAAGYLGRAVAVPIRLAAGGARRVAAGDFTSRLPTGGPGEVGQLEQSFNVMAASLERSRNELEEQNRRLVESERLKSDLVSNVSHELRTPLASVLGFSDLLLNRDLPEEDQRRYLEVIRTEAGRLATLLNDLLDLQRIERGALELSLDRFDLNELLRVQITLYSAQSALHELSFRPSGDQLIVKGDRDRLAQVLGNLLSNAIKYSPDGGDVEVRSAQVDGEAWVWIRDHGIGVAREHQDRLFTKFFRGEAGRKRGIAGTGLGLVLARQIVEAHDGIIGFESEEGRGSTFWVRIPAVAAERDSASPAARDHSQSRHGV